MERSDLFGATLEIAGAGPSAAGRPCLSTRLMAALLYLKHAFNLSDDDLVARWSENVVWHYFSGQGYYEPRLPCDATQLGHFRTAIGEAGVEELFKATIDSIIVPRTGTICALATDSGRMPSRYHDGKRQESGDDVNARNHHEADLSGFGQRSPIEERGMSWLDFSPLRGILRFVGVLFDGSKGDTLKGGAGNDKATSTAMTRMEWRSARQYAGEQTFMRFSMAMLLRAFIHKASSAARPHAMTSMHHTRNTTWD